MLMNTQEVEEHLNVVQTQYDNAVKSLRDTEDLMQRLRGRFDLLMEIKAKGEQDATGQTDTPTAKSSKRTGK